MNFQQEKAKELQRKRYEETKRGGKSPGFSNSGGFGSSGGFGGSSGGYSTPSVTENIIPVIQVRDAVECRIYNIYFIFIHYIIMSSHQRRVGTHHVLK